MGCTPKLMRFCSFFTCYLLTCPSNCTCLTCLKFWICTPKLMRFCSFLLVTCLLVQVLVLALLVSNFGCAHQNLCGFVAFYLLLAYLSKYLYLPYLSQILDMHTKIYVVLLFFTCYLLTCPSTCTCLTCLKFWMCTPKLMRFCSFLLVTCLLVSNFGYAHQN